MRRSPRVPRSALAFLAAALVAGAAGGAGAGQLAAQELSGIAVDAEGRPLPEVPIALHRVGDGTGATVATGATDADGRFRFPVEGADSAVYFVAMRHRQRMYIGPPTRAGMERVIDYVVRAEPGSEVGAITSALTGGGAATGTGAAGGNAAAGGAAAVALVAALALAVAFVFLGTAPAYRRRQRRGLLIELAGIENRLAGADGADAAGRPGADPAADTRRRDALRARLAPRT